MKSARCLLLLSACCAPAAWSADPGRLPNRQIDRPIILPAKMWQEQVSQNTVILTGDGSDPGQATIQGFHASLPAWSITDNLHWSAVPAPVFRYLLTRNNINAENGPVVRGLSLTLDGGVSSITYTAGEFEALSHLGLSFKLPVSRFFWIEGNASILAINVEDLLFGAAMGAGIQFTERTHGIATYTMSRYFGPNVPTIQGLLLKTGMNFNPWFSLGFQVSTVASGGNVLYLNPAFLLSLQW